MVFVVSNRVAFTFCVIFVFCCFFSSRFLLFYCCLKPLNQYFVKTAFVFDLFSWASQPASQQTQWQSSLAIKLSDLSCSHLSLCITPSVCVMCKRVYNKYLCFILQYDGDVDDVLFYFYFCWFWWLKICLHRTLCIMRCATDCWNSNISPHANSSLHWNTVYKWMNVFHRCKFELLLLLLSIIMLSIWSFYLLIRWCSGNNLNWIELNMMPENYFCSFCYHFPCQKIWFLIETVMRNAKEISINSYTRFSAFAKN